METNNWKYVVGFLVGIILGFFAMVVVANTVILPNRSSPVSTPPLASPSPVSTPPLASPSPVSTPPLASPSPPSLLSPSPVMTGGSSKKGFVYEFKNKWSYKYFI
jgi:hypothetical protein